MSVFFNKNMPQKSLTSDNQTSFILGRRAFFNKTYLSHDTSYLFKNLNYSFKDNNQSKPLQDKSNNLRIQRLRLTTIGSGSSKLTSQNSEISFVKKDGDINYVNTILSKVRGSGCVPPKKI